MLRSNKLQVCALIVGCLFNFKIFAAAADTGISSSASLAQVKIVAYDQAKVLRLSEANLEGIDLSKPISDTKIYKQIMKGCTYKHSVKARIKTACPFGGSCSKSAYSHIAYHILACHGTDELRDESSYYS